MFARTAVATEARTTTTTDIAAGTIAGTAAGTTATGEVGSGTSRPTVLLVLALLIGLLGAVFTGAGTANAATRTATRTVAAPVSHSAKRAAYETRVARHVLHTLNTERAAHHLHPVRMNTHLISSARQHNLAMARTDLMSHQLTGEADLGSREADAGYNWSWAGENIGWNSQMNTAGVLTLEKLMYNELPPNDGHRLNILSRNYRDIGISVYLDTTNHKVWLTTDFGHRM